MKYHLPLMTTVDTGSIRDPARMAAVLESGLLDTGREAPFDDLTRLAATLVSAPFAFATVVDDARSFWKSTFGIPIDGPRQNTVEESFCQYVVNTRSEVIISDAATDSRTMNNPSVKSMGVRAWAGFPLISPGGEILGSFCIVDTVPREWSARDIEVIKTLAAAASREIALRALVEDHRRARTRAESLAHTLQQSLLPPQLPDVPGLDVAARFHPAGKGIELVGDFYDLFQTAEDRWSFVVGDVCGKGVTAAKVAAFARYTLGAVSMKTERPSVALSWLNETMLARSPVPGIFLTAVYGTIRLQASGASVHLACAGHEPPILRRKDGRIETVDSRGPLIGILSDFQTYETQVLLAPGDSLTVYTDGVNDARNGNDVLGERAVRELIAGAPLDANAAVIASRLEKAALEFCGGVASDDIAVLVLRSP